jgi:hypothetical protein
MAIIYETTMSPSKRELVAAWLPAQPWYRDTGHEPDPIKAFPPPGACPTAPRSAVPWPPSPGRADQ